MGASDTREIAKTAFGRIRAAFPNLSMIEVKSAPNEVCFDMPVQPGLKHSISLNLQNHDELHFAVGGSFWLEWFPCTEPAKVDAFVQAVCGFISGKFRILLHYRRGRFVKAQLQAPEAEGWKTIGTYAKLALPIPWRAEKRVISNA